MKRMNTRATAGAAALTLALLAAACGSDTTEETTAAEQPTETSDAMSEMEDGEMEGMDHSMMNMGDPTATRADAVEGAALATGDFVLMDTRPLGYDETEGTAWIARHPGGTTVTVELSGLPANTDFISHVHADVCANDGGDHYQFEVGGSEMPPNEIHLAFTSDDEGNGFMTAENAQIAGLDAVAFVVHPADLIDNKVACVDFVELEEGAAAAAIEAGVDPDAVKDDEHDHSDHDMDDEMEQMDG